MKKLRKRMIVALLSMLCVLLLFVFVEHIRGKRAYDSMIAELQSRGERLNVEELLPYRPDDSENAAIELIELAKELPDLPSTTSSGTPVMSFVEPGYARPGYKTVRWESPTLLYPEESEVFDWEEIRQTVETSRVSFEQISRALEKPYLHTGFSYTNGFYEDMKIVELASYRTFLTAHTVIQMRDADTDGAVQSLKTMLLFVERLEDERLIIFQMIKRAIATICLRLTWDILTMPDLSVEHCRSLIQSWEKISFIRHMEISIEMERAMTIDVQNNMKHSKARRDTHFEQIEAAGEMVPGYYDFPTSGWVLHWLHIPLWRAAWIDQDFVYGIRQWEDVIKASRLAWRGSWADAKEACENLDTGNLFLLEDGSDGLSWYQRSKFLTSANPEISVGGGIVKRVMQGETEKQLAIAALALHSYKLQTGSYPESLSELVPENLNEIPKDYMDRNSLRYQKTEDGNFLLYSVGDDTEDAGGDPGPIGDAELYTTIWDGKDAVWPKVFRDEVNGD